MMSLWDALRMNMMISYQELVRTFLKRHLIYYLLIYNVTEDSKLNFNYTLIIVICGLADFTKL